MKTMETKDREQLEKKHREMVIFKNQNVSEMIGHIGWDGYAKVVTITGQCEKTGLPKFDGTINRWVGFDCLREDVTFIDITGLSVRQAKRKILHYFPTTFILKEKQLRKEIEKAIK
jgi:hypothetical protein